MQVLVMVLLFAPFFVFALQNSYLVIERIEIYKVDKNYVSNVEYSFKRLNKTNYGFNISFELLKDFGDDVGVSNIVHRTACEFLFSLFLRRISWLIINTDL